MFGPSGIGLLIYFLVGRKERFIKCVNCSKSIPSNSKYCNKCGNVVTEIKTVEKIYCYFFWLLLDILLNKFKKSFSDFVFSKYTTSDWFSESSL